MRKNEKYNKVSERCRSRGKIYEARGKLLFMTRALTPLFDEFIEKYVTVLSIITFIIYYIIILLYYLLYYKFFAFLSIDLKK